MYAHAYTHAPADFRQLKFIKTLLKKKITSAKSDVYRKAGHVFIA